jgi:tetratricopeptide (TPR) repeat protein
MDGRLKDDGIAALLKALAVSGRGLCIVTTRYSIPDLRAYRQSTAPEHKLLRLSTDAGVTLLRQLGVKTGSKADFEKLVEDVDGHALTLQIMGGFLARAFGGDIRRRDQVRFEKADNAIQGGHAFRAMSAYETWMALDTDEARRELAFLRLTGLFDRPAPWSCIESLLRPPAIPGLTEPIAGVSEQDRNLALDTLESAKLLTVNRDGSGAILSLDAHPLIREYFAKRLRETHAESWRAAHKRLYEYLCATTSDREPAPTLEALEHLYLAVVHGCHAGLQQEACINVYVDRILRGTGNGGFYSTRQLGAFGSDLGAIACFFEQPWKRVAPTLAEAHQAWLLNTTAVCLRALGRLAEAIEPMRAGLSMAIKQENWTGAAISAGNMSELELTLGRVADAARDAELSVIYADRCDDAGQRMLKRTTVGNALHHAGRHVDAEERFRDAERMQADLEPKYPLLYSLRGFQYCDLLMAEPERAVWRLVLDPEFVSPELGQIEPCRVVERRTVKVLEWQEMMRGAPQLDFALHHLTLGRVALCATILEGAGLSSKTSDLGHVETGLNSLRRLGVLHHLPRGLLARAMLRALSGDPAGAQSDLDEAHDIAERGPMRLFLADIHLHRARLFFRAAPYPWSTNPDGSPRGPRDDLAAAEKLINECGYHRRDEELADAKRVILGK